MAPEQVEGKPVDGRCDQYSFAILVWEALTGTLRSPASRSAS